MCKQILDRVLGFEGGIKDVGDGKGITRFGQTPKWLKRFKLPTPTTTAEARQNYVEWLRLTSLDHLCDQNDPLALFVIDWAVHSGHETAIKSLQEHLGVVRDGVIGPITASKIPLNAEHRHAVAIRILADRIRFIGRLVRDNPKKNIRYVSGWNNRLADLVEGLETPPCRKDQNLDSHLTHRNS